MASRTAKQISSNRASWTSILVVSALLSANLMLAQGISFSSSVAPTASFAVHPPTSAPTGPPSKRSKKHKQKSAAFGLDHKAPKAQSGGKRRKTSRIRPETETAFVRDSQFKGRKQQKRQSSDVAASGTKRTKRLKKSTNIRSDTKTVTRIPNQDNHPAPKKSTKKTKHRKKTVTKVEVTRPQSENRLASEKPVSHSQKAPKRKKSKSKIPSTAKEVSAPLEMAQEKAIEETNSVVDDVVPKPESKPKKKTKRRKKASSVHSQATSTESSTCNEPEEAGTTTTVDDSLPAIDTQGAETVEEESPDARPEVAIDEDATVEEDVEVCEAPSPEADSNDVSVAEQDVVEEDDGDDQEEAAPESIEEEAKNEDSSPEGEEVPVEVEAHGETIEEENDQEVAADDEVANEEAVGEDATIEQENDGANQTDETAITEDSPSQSAVDVEETVEENDGEEDKAEQEEKSETAEEESLEVEIVANEETEITKEESPETNTEDGNDESIVEENEDDVESPETCDSVPEESSNPNIATDDNESPNVEEEENEVEEEEDKDDDDDDDQGGDIQTSEKVENKAPRGFIDPEQDVVSFIEEILHEDVRSWIDDTDSHAENVAKKPRGGHIDIKEKTETTTDSNVSETPEIVKDEEPNEKPKIMDRESLEKLGDKDSDAVVSVVTWNLAEDSPLEEDAAFIRKFRKNGVLPDEGSDLVLISGQECENIKPRRSEGRRSREYRRLMIKMLGRGYVPLALHLLGGIQFGLFAKRSFVKEIVDVSVADVTCGIGNVFHNKGAIAAFLTLKARNQGDDDKKRSKTVRMVFVTAHLAAHVKNADARDSDFWRISSELEAQVPEGFLPRKPPNQKSSGSFLFDSVDRVFFCGDLNYRLDLPRELTEHAILHGQDSEVFEYLKHDQLIQSMAEGKAFPGFAEGKITFLPTFKFDKESSSYDTSHKQRIPAWTDRILFQPASGIRVLEYQSVPDAQSSDHRPVFGSYRIGMEGKVLPPAPKKRRRKRTADYEDDY